MSNPEIVAALAQAGEAIRRLLTSSPELREAVQAVARVLIEATKEGSGGVSREQSGSAAGGMASGGQVLSASPLESVSTAGSGRTAGEIAGQAGTGATVATAPVPLALTPRKITGPRVVSEPVLDAEEAVRALSAGLGLNGTSPRQAAPLAGPAPAAGTTISIALDMVARRCRLQAEACVFAKDRNHLGFDVVKPRYDKLRQDAEPVQPCYLWAIHRDTEFLDDSLLETAAGCYTNFAAAADLVHAAMDDTAGLEMLAEAQAALFQLLYQVEQTRGGDRDQRAVFAWLRGRIDRGDIPMSVLDAARNVDPSAWRGLEARLTAARERLDTTRKGERARRQALNAIQYHAGRIVEAHDAHHVEGGDGGEVGDLTHDWHKVENAASAFLEAGGQASDPGLIEVLAPVAEFVPESMLQGEPFSIIMAYLDERLTQEEEGDGAESAAPARRVTDELLRARELLRGKTIVLLGGICRPKSKRLIERELELKELVWLSSGHHASIAPFEDAIARPDVGAVLMMIRWSSHSFEGVQEFCIRHNKPYVRVPAGYNPSQLAHQILLQQGKRLAEV